MQYKPIENYHVENAILGKNFNLGMISSFFDAFTLKDLGSNIFPCDPRQHSKINQCDYHAPLPFHVSRNNFQTLHIFYPTNVNNI
jgi:hypothetical protein